MQEVNRQSKRLDYLSPSKDHFVEGQLSLRSPVIIKSQNVFAKYQTHQSKRLASPKRLNISPLRASKTINCEKESPFKQSARQNILKSVYQK